jgi:hypothetical protein
MALEELARKHPFTKFVKIHGGECIPGYPDRNMPTLLVYRDRDVARVKTGAADPGGGLFFSQSLQRTAAKLLVFGFSFLSYKRISVNTRTNPTPRLARSSAWTRSEARGT